MFLINRLRHACAPALAPLFAAILLVSVRARAADPADARERGQLAAEQLRAARNACERGLKEERDEAFASAERLLAPRPADDTADAALIRLAEAIEWLVPPADPQRVYVMVTTAMVGFMAMLAFPDPITKILLAALTLAAVAYMGWDTIFSIRNGWKALQASRESAIGFADLRAAGERFGTIIGEHVGRIIVMLVVAAMGASLGTVSARLAALPGFSRAAQLFQAHCGFSFGAVTAGGVQAVTIAASSAVIALTPGVAWAATSAMDVSGGGSEPPQAAPVRFKNMDAYRKAMGAAGPGKQWHHIVEQNPGNLAKFGPERLHSTENVMPLDEKLHARNQRVLLIEAAVHGRAHRPPVALDAIVGGSEGVWARDHKAAHRGWTMTAPALAQLPSDELVERYAAAAVAHGAATECGNSEEGNHSADLLLAINQELRRRGQEVHRSLLRLLSHPQPAVRGWAGCHALEIAPQEAERVLEEVARLPKSLIGFTAEWTLREWRAGRLRIP